MVVAACELVSSRYPHASTVTTCGFLEIHDKLIVLVSEGGYLLVEDVVGLMAGVADGLAERAQHGVPVGGERL